MSFSNFYIYCLAYSGVSRSLAGFSTVLAFLAAVSGAKLSGVVSDSDVASAAAGTPLYDSYIASSSIASFNRFA